MKRIIAILLLLCCCSPATAEIRHLSASASLTLHARVMLTATTSFDVTLTEGTSSGDHNYVATDAAILDAAPSDTLAAGVYSFTVRDGSQAVVGGGTLYWLGTSEDTTSGRVLTVDNTEVVDARVIELSERDDGTTVGVKPIRMRVGELLPWWVSTKRIGGGRWCSRVTSATSSDATELSVPTSGVNRELGVVWIDSASAVVDDTYTVSVTILMQSGQVIKGKLTVQIKGD